MRQHRFFAVSVACTILLFSRAGFAQEITTISKASDEPISFGNDPRGDADLTRGFFPHPFYHAGSSVVDNTITAIVPTWLLGDPTSFRWYLSTAWDYAFYQDRLPDNGTVLWTSGSSSTATDPLWDVDAGLYDAVSATVSLDDLSHIRFEHELRGEPLPKVIDGSSEASFHLTDLDIDVRTNTSGNYDLSSHIIIIGERVNPWAAAGYLDIVRSEIFQPFKSQLRFEMTLNGNVPSTPDQDEGDPWFVWWIYPDTDPDGRTSLATWTTGVRYNSSSKKWEGFLRKLNDEGSSFSDYRTFSEFMEVDGKRISVALSIADLGIEEDFLWTSGIRIQVGPPGERYMGPTDYAPEWDDTIQAKIEPSDAVLEFETPNAFVYSVPHGPSLDRTEFGDSVAEIFVTTAVSQAMENIVDFSLLGPVGTFVGLIIDIMEAYLDQFDPVIVVPIATDLACSNCGLDDSEISGTISVHQDKVSAVVILDFLGVKEALGGAFSTDRFDGPLELCLTKNNPFDESYCARKTELIPLQCITTRQKAESACLKELDTENRTYFVVPKTAHSVSDFAPACALCSNDDRQIDVRAQINGIGDNSYDDNKVFSVSMEEEGEEEALTAHQSRSFDPPAGLSASQTLVGIEFFNLSEENSTEKSSGETCNANITARAVDDTTSTTVIPAFGFQSVSLGSMGSSEWSLEITPTCDIGVRVTFSENPDEPARLCEFNENRLCLNDGRFGVEVNWADFQDQTGVAKAVSLTGDTGYFWFFNPKNIELVVKALDATALNDHFWIFYGALSNVEYSIRVTDYLTGAVRTYNNPSRQFASAGHTLAFLSENTRKSNIDSHGEMTDSIRLLASTTAAGFDNHVDHTQITIASGTEPTGGCRASTRRLCLNQGRFSAEVEWWDFQGNHGIGTAVQLTEDTGYFWFFRDTNVELILKALDGRTINDHFWVFYGALSNVRYKVTVTDTHTGTVKVYENPERNFASVGDTGAFFAP